MKLEIGQTLFSYKLIGGRPTFSTHKVTSVGKKFYTVDNERQATRFIIDTLRREDQYQRDVVLSMYVSLGAVQEKIELDELMDSIKNRFSGYGVKDLTLDQARKIKSILEEK